MIDISAGQKEILNEFRELVSDLRQSDPVLLRFLKARNYNIHEAEQMLRRSIQWRQKNDMENAFEWQIPPKLQQRLTLGITGEDFDGNVVIYIPVGKWQIRQLVEEGYQEDMFRHLYQIIEWGADEVDKTGKLYTLIVDLEGVDYWMLSHFKTIQGAIKVLQTFEACFPELLFKCLAINVPSIFLWIWPLSKQIFTGVTLSRINLLGSNEKHYIQELVKHIPVSELPPFLCDVAAKYIA